MRRRLLITGRHPATVTDLADIIFSTALAAGPPLAPARQQPRGQLWSWAAAALLHAAVISLLFVSFQRKPPEGNALAPTGISVVYDAGSPSAQAPRLAPVPAPAKAPAPSAPPPQTALNQPEVNLDMPQLEVTPMPSPLPTPTPQAQPQSHPARRPAPHPPQKYTVMNGMSFGNSSPAPPVHAKQSLDLDLAQSDAQAAMAPDVSIEGDVGQDWESGFNKWVYAHLYYPQAAEEQNQEGTVTVEFTAHRNGTVTGLHMVGDGSGSPFLDQAWLGIFAQNNLPKFPPGGSDTLKIKATVRYELER